MDNILKEYNYLLLNHKDFTIKVVCVQYTSSNEVHKVIDMFNFMNKHTTNATFESKVCEDMNGYMCTCVGYMQASYFLQNFIDMYVEQGNIRPLFYLWKEPYKDNSKELKEITLKFETMSKNEFELIQKIKKVLEVKTN